MDAIIGQIIDHAERSFPNECCGLVLSVNYGHASLLLLPCDNQSPTPGSSFLIDPLVTAKNSERIFAIYHSHPNRNAEPSEADIVSSERCGAPFIIVSVPGNDIFTYTPGTKKHLDYHGRDFCYGVMDCLSLVTDYYHQELQIIIDNGSRKSWGWWNEIENYHAFVNGFKSQGFYEVDTPKKHDLVIMTIEGKCPNHVAIYMGDSIILHHPSYNTPSRHEMYGQYWRQNTNVFLRHKSAHFISAAL